jgi:hypothetical protein
VVLDTVLFGDLADLDLRSDEFGEAFDSRRDEVLDLVLLERLAVDAVLDQRVRVPPGVLRTGRIVIASRTNPPAKRERRPEGRLSRNTARK